MPALVVCIGRRDGRLPRRFGKSVLDRQPAKRCFCEMSLPKETLDQLLSGYLDDALTDVERTQIERLLRDDPEVDGKLRDLRELHDSLRELRREDEELTLGANFADRVLKATVDQATAEGLSEDHPVMLLIQQPSTTVVRTGMPLVKIAAAVAALAATIVVAIVMSRPAVKDPEQNLVVQNEPLVEAVGPVDVPDEEPVPLIPAPGQQLVQQEGPSASEAPEPLKMPKENGGDHLVAGTPDVPPASLSPEALLRGFVMVVDVRQSTLGRENDVISKAMTEAGLAAPDQKRIEKNVVGFGKKLVTQNAVENDSDVSVLYLVDSATKLDTFLNILCADLDGIESVGFSYVMDAPIVGLAAQIAPVDKSEVREIGRRASLELQDDGSGTLQVIANELGDRQFNLVARDNGIAGLIQKNRNDGKNVWSSLFVLVR